MSEEKALQELDQLIKEWKARPAKSSEIIDWLNYVFGNLSQPSIIKPGAIRTDKFPGCESDYFIEDDRVECFRGLGIEALPETAFRRGNKTAYLGMHHPVIPRRREIVHDSVFAELSAYGRIVLSYDFNIPRWLVNNGVFGNPSPNRLTYLKYKGTISPDKLGPLTQIEDSQNPLERILRVVVNTKKLMKMRDVYSDPEAVADADNDEALRAGRVRPEYGNTFCVFGGIPFEAIKKVEFG